MEQLKERDAKNILKEYVKDQKGKTEDSSSTDFVKGFVEFAKTDAGQQLLAPLVQKISKFVTEKTTDNPKPKPKGKRPEPESGNQSNNSESDFNVEKGYKFIRDFLEKLPDGMTVEEIKKQIKENEEGIKKIIKLKQQGKLDNLMKNTGSKNPEGSLI